MTNQDSKSKPSGRLPEVIPGNDLAQVIDQAITAHKAWMRTFELAIDGIDADKLATMSVADHSQCNLGKWLHAAEQDSLEHDSVFRSIREIHIEFHQFAQVILEHLEQGEVEEAGRLLDKKLGFASHLLILLLEQFREPAAAAAQNVSTAGPAVVDVDAGCRLSRWLGDIEAGADKNISLIARSASAMIRDLDASPEQYEQVPYLFWLVEDLADDRPDLWPLIEQGADDCKVCSALLHGKRNGMLLVN